MMIVEEYQTLQPNILSVHAVQPPLTRATASMCKGLGVRERELTDDSYNVRNLAYNSTVQAPRTTCTALN